MVPSAPASTTYLDGYSEFPGQMLCVKLIVDFNHRN